MKAFFLVLALTCSAMADSELATGVVDGSGSSDSMADSENSKKSFNYVCSETDSKKCQKLAKKSFDEQKYFDSKFLIGKFTCDRDKNAAIDCKNITPVDNKLPVTLLNVQKPTKGTKATKLCTVVSSNCVLPISSAGDKMIVSKPKCEAGYVGLYQEQKAKTPADHQFTTTSVGGSNSVLKACMIQKSYDKQAAALPQPILFGGRHN